MRALSSIVVFAVFVLALQGCGWFGPRTVPDPVEVVPEGLGVVLQAPKGWSVRHEPSLNRSLLFTAREGDRDHAVIVQKLSSHRSWRQHADQFRDDQDKALDKIISEAAHEIAEGGVVFKTRQEPTTERRPVILKLRYFIEVGNDAVLLDMAAPEGAFDAGLYEAVAKTVRPAAADAP